MRSFSAWITGFLIAGLCPCVHSQTTVAQTTVAKDTQTKEVPQLTEAKGMPPRSGPTDFPAHVQVGDVTIGAEFLGHSVPRQEGPLSTEDYVVVETGIYGPAEKHLLLSVDNFSLRINGKKTPLSSQPYGFVARSIKDPEWAPPEAAKKDKPKTSFGGGGGQSDSPPPVIHVPIELQRAMAQHLRNSAMPEGDRPLPRAGLLFFEYRGKTSGIHSLELIYSGPAGKANLALQP